MEYRSYLYISSYLTVSLSIREDLESLNVKLERFFTNCEKAGFTYDYELEKLPYLNFHCLNLVLFLTVYLELEIEIIHRIYFGQNDHHTRQKYIQ